jgi:phosphatidylglycerol:prolipoprotein diacylglycerol transferase
MRPIPVQFHLGPLTIHTYGIGLAITFFFAYAYFRRRLERRGYETEWLPAVFLWVILAAIIGARTLHVVSNFSYYRANPVDVFAIWHGGLSSFGGLLFAVPVGVILQRRRCPELTSARALDLVAPVLLAAWAVGRLLGPQLMVAGGGHPTHQWFGMYYADQVGRRLPVPIFQAMEDATVYVILIILERHLDRWADGTPRTGYPCGAVLGTAMVLWGVERSLDEHLWLGEDGKVGSALVQIAGVLLAIGGLALLVRTRSRWRAWLAAGAPGGHGNPSDEGARRSDDDAERGGEAPDRAEDTVSPDPVSSDDGQSETSASGETATTGATASRQSSPDPPPPAAP